MSTLPAVRVLLANEPRAYREAQAESLRDALPHAHISIADPAGMDDAIAAFDPHVVVCSTLSPAVRTQPLAWVLLYPDRANLAVIAVGGMERTVPGVALDDIFAVVDDAARVLLPIPQP
jgi:hypothetical protein